jgi:hypothetical protein
MPAGGEGIGDDHLCAGADVVLVRRPHGIGVGLEGGPAPGLGVHGNAPRLQLGSHGAVDNQDLARGEFCVEPSGSAAADRGHNGSPFVKTEDASNDRQWPVRDQSRTGRPPSGVSAILVLTPLAGWLPSA